MKIRKGVKFHNGEVFDAEAAAFTVRTFRDSKGSGGSGFKGIQDAKALDPDTLEITTKEADVALLSQLIKAYAIPPKYHDQVGEAEYGLKPIGTGPYRFADWQKGESIKLVANPDYWEGAPAIKEVTFRFVPEAATRTAMLVSGQADLIRDVAPETVPQIKQSGVATVKSAPARRRMFIQMNTTIPPFNDIRVRRALAHAVDNQELVDKVLSGFAYPVDGLFPPNMPSHDEKNFVAYKYDPEKAKQLLAEAGHPNGVSFTFYHTIGRYLKDKELAEAIAGQLAKVGFKVQLAGLESGAFFDKLRSGTNRDGMDGAHLLTLGAEAPDEHRYVQTHFWNKGNYQYGNLPETNDLIAKAAGLIDRAERTKLYKEVELRLTRDLVSWKPLFDQAGVYGVSNRLSWEPYADEFLRLEEVGRQR
jgi:peptide/nickel transport system substrate-binding protein